MRSRDTRKSYFFFEKGKVICPCGFFQMDNDQSTNSSLGGFISDGLMILMMMMMMMMRYLFSMAI